MNDRDIRESESITRMREFGVDNAADFPPTSLGGQKFAEMKTLADELDLHGSNQSLGRGALLTSTGIKEAARKSIRQQMRAISETAKGMESIYPGIKDTFRVPTTNGDEALINAARAFITAATPMKAEFIKRELPETFLDDLSAAIERFESASDSQSQSAGKRVNATASIKQLLDRGMTLKHELDPIVRNKYRNDPAKLAVWESASHVERTPRRKKSPPPPAPTT
jgi:hypothetical protein